MIALKNFKNALYFLSVEELKDICNKLKLPSNCRKAGLIQHVISFVESGTTLKNPSFPEISKAAPKKIYPLKTDTLIVIGSYKNDLQTRLFFKKIIGTHFHFTAFGIDWIKEKWLAGTPPTYGEFAKFWQEEYERRKKEKPKPKQELAYMNFVQKYHLTNKNSLKKDQLVQEWTKTRVEQFSIVKTFLSENHLLTD